MEGDSLTAGHWSGLMPGLLQVWLTNDISAGGETVVSHMIPEFATEALPLLRGPPYTDILILRGGTNDILFNTSAADLEAGIQSYCTTARAAGFKVVIATITPGTAFWYPAPKEAVRVAVNTWIKANWANWADAIWKLDEVTELLDPTDATYYTDGLHCITVAASELIAGKALPIVKALWGQ